MGSRVAQQYRVAVFGEPRAGWCDSHAEAKHDAIALRLASWDAERREWYIAVPVDIEARDVRIEVEERPVAGRRGEAWNDEDIANLRALARADVDIAGIARRLERTREAVQAKARRLGVTIRS